VDDDVAAGPNARAMRAIDHADCARCNELTGGASGRRASSSQDAPVALLYSNEDRGAPLGADALNALVARRSEYDLFLSFVVPGPGGFVAGRRDAKGKFRKGPLEQNGAALVAELVQERRPLRASGMKCVRHGGIGDPVRAFERARAVVDEPLGTRAWRSIRRSRTSAATTRRKSSCSIRRRS
jgi:hypothetical protein